MLHPRFLLFAALGLLIIGRSAAATPLVMNASFHDGLASPRGLISVFGEDFLPPQPSIELPANHFRADASMNRFLEGLWLTDAAGDQWGDVNPGIGASEEEGSGSAAADLVWHVITTASHPDSAYLVASVVLSGSTRPGTPLGTATSNEARRPGNGPDGNRPDAKPGRPSIHFDNDQSRHGDKKPHGDPKDGTYGSAPISTPEPSTSYLVVLAALVGFTVRRFRAAKSL